MQDIVLYHNNVKMVIKKNKAFQKSDTVCLIYCDYHPHLLSSIVHGVCPYGFALFVQQRFPPFSLPLVFPPSSF